ncbi:hypothetical protein [Alteromonas lipolytica]|uniref:LRAT domain-containing protein n=1 Tax=Alteromonas lipolytica TaxID=1856405 RepID=A0A1E8FJC0_9ALTE|nr:hypothetical protein [Alteromonas lipolytica]OFI35846.1 hypothetical protein BFC17_11250 [Alteromonas lipolytica]
MKYAAAVDGHSANVEHYPGESAVRVEPLDGAIVCCGIYGVFEHTGIWVDNHIVELHGSGLVKAVSPQRFLAQRSGEQIYVLCDKNLQPLIADQTHSRAIARIFNYIEYDPWQNNCHRFTFQCVTGYSNRVSSFYDFNLALSRFFACRLFWQPAQITA